MSVWAQLEHVRSRLTRETIDTTSQPSQAEVQGWLDEAEAETAGILAAGGVSTTYAADTRGALTLRKHIADFVAGMVRAAWASADGDADNTDGQREIELYQARIEDMRATPASWSARLGDAGATTASARIISSHVTAGETSTPVYSVNDLDGAF